MRVEPMNNLILDSIIFKRRKPDPDAEDMACSHSKLADPLPTATVPPVENANGVLVRAMAPEGTGEKLDVIG